MLATAQSVWYQAKALELAAELFFIAQDDQELFCQRHQRLSFERVDKAIALLRSDFSQAFHDTFGCCAGLYPLRTLTQKSSVRRRR